MVSMPTRLCIVQTILHVSLYADFMYKARDVQAFDIDAQSCLKVSAKTGLGLETVLPAVIEQVPCPVGTPAGPLRMLLFDAFHDEYR